MSGILEVLPICKATSHVSTTPFDD